MLSQNITFSSDEERMLYLGNTAFKPAWFVSACFVVQLLNEMMQRAGATRNSKETLDQAA